MNWLQGNGYHHLRGRTCVVINHTVPGKPRVDITDLVQQSNAPQGGRVVVLPWDGLAAGSRIQFSLLSANCRRRILELAAALSDGFDPGARTATA